MAIHKDLKIAYVIFELESYIGVYSISEENGALTEIGKVILPNLFSYLYGLCISFYIWGHL